MIQNTSIHNAKGFTLVETLVSLGIFMIVLVIAVGSLVSLIDANRKARSQKIVSDNLSTSIETMSRTIREGSNYTITDSGHTLTLTALNGSSVSYTQAGNQINRIVNGSNPVALTAPDIRVSDLTFSNVSYGGGGTEQPKIRISISGEAGDTLRTTSDFSIQTLVTRRYRSIGLPSGGGSIACALDLAIILDVSGSLNDTELQQAKDAASTIVNNLTISPVDANIAILRFSTDGALDLNLSSNSSTILSAIQNVARMGGGTNLAGGVMLARQVFPGSRSNAPDAILVITDGQANRCSDSSGIHVNDADNSSCSPPLAAGVNAVSQATSELQLAKDAGGYVYMIGVGVPNSVLGANYTPYNGMKYEDWMRNIGASPGGYASVADYTALQDEVSSYNCQFFGGAPRPIDIQPF